MTKMLLIALFLIGNRLGFVNQSYLIVTNRICLSFKEVILSNIYVRSSKRIHKRKGI